DIVLYAGTGSAGPRLYQQAAELGWSDTIFCGPGSLENGDYRQYIDDPRGGPLFAVDFAAPAPSRQPAVDALPQPTMYSALAYDATTICLLAIQRVLHQRGGLLGSFDVRTRLALAAGSLDIGVESSFRERVISRITWLNTKKDQN